jgi:hypothetical protein
LRTVYARLSCHFKLIKWQTIWNIMTLFGQALYPLHYFKHVYREITFYIRSPLKKFVLSFQSLMISSFCLTLSWYISFISFNFSKIHCTCFFISSSRPQQYIHNLLCKFTCLAIWGIQTITGHNFISCVDYYNTIGPLN